MGTTFPLLNSTFHLLPAVDASHRQRVGRQVLVVERGRAVIDECL